MKKNLLWGAMFTFIAPLSLMVASCQSEEDVASGKAGKGAAITVEATYPGYGMDSRVTLGEENADIVGYWSAGDKLLITDGQGNNIGTLDLTDGAGTKHATFTGNLAADVANGTHDFRFTYLGAGVDVEGVSQTYTLDISTQDGKFESLIQRWLFTGTAEYTVANGNSYAKETLTFSNLNPTAHFELIFPEGVSMNGETVTISGDNLKSSASVDLASGTLTDLTDGNITVTGTDGDFYINMLPAQDVAPTFTVTVDGVEYQGSLDARNWAADEFVRKGHTVGVPVYMNKVAPAVDHTKNPLLKWAEADLVYNSTSKTSSIATSYTVQGSLYQWGRNIGWSNYKAAMGGYTTNYGRYFYQYATYNRNYKTGTGLHGGEDDVNDYSYDSANDSFTEELFFMNPNGTDYWIGSNGGATWQERAKKCGYNTSVCPNGWRMPTEADFLEIKPSEPLHGSGSLASVLNSRVELKAIEGVCTYAMRWTAETKSNKAYLRIDALVVPEGFSEGNLSSINWNDENVVTRYFGANGSIHAFYHVNKIQNGPQVDNFPVARPMPGVETHTDRLWQNGTYYTVLWDNITDYSVNNAGYYWMADKKGVFTFEDNTRVKAAFSNRLSVLGSLEVNAQDCYSIRCVKAE